MSDLLVRLSQRGAPEIDGPAPEKLIAGAPEFRTWNLEERDGLYCGIWQATKGKWRIQYDEWEYCLFLEGYSIITEADGTEHHLHAGDRFVIRPGLSGTWEVIETTTKDYVIRL